MSEKNIEIKLTNADNLPKDKLVDLLISSTRELNVGSAHVHLFNTQRTKDLTVAISVYDGEKPADMVLEELTAWAEKNDPDLLTRIETISADMSWNEENPV